MKKWILAACALAGVLTPIPFNLLVKHFALLQDATGLIWYGYAQVAMMFLSYLCLGVCLALLKNLKAAVRAGRRFVRWPEFALGALLPELGFLPRLWNIAQLIPSIAYTYENGELTPILLSSDALYIPIILAGFLITDAFRKEPLKKEARAEGERAGYR